MYAITRLHLARNTATLLRAALCIVLIPALALARDVPYEGGEIGVYVVPGEPTQLQFPDTIAVGYKTKFSSLSLDKKDSDIIIIARDTLTEEGEVILVRLEDGRTYSVRVALASHEHPRDAIVRLLDKRSPIIGADETETPEYERDKPKFAPASAASGLLREMVLVAEFGKKAVPGYRVSDRYQGQTVLDDGTLHATIDRILIGPSLWGYVLNAQNLLDQTQKVNPATFRLDGTRAVSMKNWELSPRPLNVEQQISGKHSTKVYIVTKAR